MLLLVSGDVSGYGPPYPQGSYFTGTVKEASPSSVSAQAHQQFQLERGITLPRQYDGDILSFADDLCVARFGAEALHGHVFAEERNLLPGLGGGNLNTRVELRDALVHRAGGLQHEFPAERVGIEPGIQ